MCFSLQNCVPHPFPVKESQREVPTPQPLVRTVCGASGISRVGSEGQGMPYGPLDCFFLSSQHAFPLRSFPLLSVQEASKHPNLGILKWGLGWILSRMFLATGWKLPPVLSRLNLLGHHFGTAHASQMYIASLLAFAGL